MRGNFKEFSARLRTGLLGLGQDIKNRAQRAGVGVARKRLARVPRVSGLASRGLHGGVGSPSYLQPPDAEVPLGVPVYLGLRAEAPEDGYDYGPKIEEKHGVVRGAFLVLRRAGSAILRSAVSVAAEKLR